MSAAPPLRSVPSSNGQPRPPTANGGGGRHFDHIDDLKAEALTGFNSQQSVGQLLDRANKSLTLAKTHIDFRRPDVAFVEYLRAYEIAVEVLPRHRDKVDFIHDQHGEKKLLELQLGINSLSSQFKVVKDTIIDNNTRSGVRPKGSKSQNGPNHTRTESAGRAADVAAHKAKPAVAPKPDKLHSRAPSQAGVTANGASKTTNGDALADRFAQLRAGKQVENGMQPSSRSSTSSLHGQTVSMPAATDFGGNGFEALSRSSVPVSKPQGPRVMPDGNNGLPRSMDLPLETDFSATMIKPPSPIYSPARNMQTTGDIAPPRHSARSLERSTSRKSSLIPSSASATAPNGSIEYFPSTTTTGDVPSSGSLPRRKSVHVPKETRVSAQRLYDYLRLYQVLLIDFRTREEFDQGHIYTRNIICVEPFIVQQGMSAAELADKLVLSPEEEQDLFVQRDQFDLVVYYDTETRSESYLTQPHNEMETRLRYLHETLYDFNPDKPLQRPPILLVGGISAWADLLGNQALKITNTQTKAKPGRPLQRQKVARDAPLRLPKRPLREYNPLDAEEERKWRARAQSESVPETSAFDRSSEDGADGGFIEGDVDSLRDESSIDDFNARFPDAHTLSLQKPSTAKAQQAPDVPAKVPQYPATPSPSVYPPVPARPAPAAPRMSYTGVSDRAVSQSTPTTRTSSQLIPYIPPKYLASNLRLPRTGLANFGSTCYMNATLQALSATTPLSIMFFDDQFKKLVQKESWKGSRGLLPDIYANTIRSLWKGDVTYIKPTTFFNFVGRLNSMFRDPSQQQDAQEFFSMIVDVLHEDLNSNYARNPLQALTEKQERIREQMPRILVAKEEWGRYTHRDNSFLTSLFYSQQASRLKCPHCGLTSTQYDALALLQVEIPDRKEAQLQDCLKQHFKDELLDEDNQWTCPNCKAPRRAWKKLTMTRAPPFLVVGLKRFKTNARSGDQRKLRTAVRFPLVGLDMEEFMLAPPSPAEAQAIAAQYGVEKLKTDASLTPPYIYDAYAVVRHLGESTRSGHYIAAVKDKARGCWRYFNDSTATDFEPDRLSPSKALDNDQAYLIFYQRRPPTETNKM